MSKNVPARRPAAPTPPLAAPALVTAPGALLERARVAAILNHPEAAGRDTLARHLALATDMPVAEAVGHLAVAPRGPTPIAAAAMGAAATARAALGLAPDAARDLAMAQGVEAAFAGQASADASSARWAADFEAGAAAARELLGGRT